MSDEEDYMSSAFLTKIEDVKPGVSVNREGKRLLRINANREDAAEKQRREKPKSKDEREREKLEEGINKPIGSETKGFKLLAMMGYKEGMSLGRRRQEEDPERGIKQPIGIQVKTDRAGIGLEEERREAQRTICEAHMESMRRRARMEEELAVDFRQRKRFLSLQKQLLSDIQRLRKTCQEMDIRIDKQLPDEYWYWPIYSNKGEPNEAVNDEADEPVKQKRAKTETTAQVVEEKEEEQPTKYRYSNGREAPVAINFGDLDDRGLRESLAQIMDYMRGTHRYCFYCGCTFSSDEEMDSHCPGPTREDHEE